MKKRLIAMLLLVTVASSILTGCGEKEDDPKTWEMQMGDAPTAAISSVGDGTTGDISKLDEIIEEIPDKNETTKVVDSDNISYKICELPNGIKADIPSTFEKDLEHPKSDIYKSDDPYKSGISNVIFEEWAYSSYEIIENAVDFLEWTNSDVIYEDASNPESSVHFGHASIYLSNANTFTPDGYAKIDITITGSDIELINEVLHHIGNTIDISNLHID